MVAEQLLGDTRPELDRSLNLLALHDLLQHDRRGDVQRHARVVTLAVTGSALEERVVICDPGLLRSGRNAVDVGSKRDDRLPRPPGRHPGRGNAGDPFLDAEALLPQDGRQVLGCLELLKAEFAEAEHRVDHLLRELVQVLHAGDRLGLESAKPRVGLLSTLPSRHGRRRAGLSCKRMQHRDNREGCRQQT